MATVEALERWVEVCTAEYEALQRGRGDALLDSYAGVDPAEFFAVTTELFFDLPVELEEAKPALYQVLRDFYRQDPAQRVRDYSSQRK
jgi:Mlc titration factor MtfA (ptsG expression regulator)